MTDRDYMQRAIELAINGLGYTNPNPLVGAVIVKNNRIIGEGYHARYGELHAERHALSRLTENAEGATMYVTLEPCCHYGKQPPCTEAIVEHGISRVVIGSADPNPLVAGKGVQMLKEHGIEVTENYMREECDAINPVFFHYITTGRPYIVMKYAMTMDGKIATKTGESKWITNESSRNYVQELRHQYSGIMVGINTVLADDPMLNVRIAGKRSPIRIICDSSLRIPVSSRLVRTAKEYPTVIAYAHADNSRIAELEAFGLTLIQCTGDNGQIDLNNLLKKLGEMKIDSILVEGGGELNDSFMRSNLVDEVKVFIAPKMFGGKTAYSPVSGMGVAHPADASVFKLYKTTLFEDDILIEYRRK